MTEASDYTPPIMAFVSEMFAEMRANEYKDTWKGLGVAWALEEVQYHVAKLHWAIRHVADDPKKYLDQIREYSADTANLLMMLADEAGVLRYAPAIENATYANVPKGGFIETNWNKEHIEKLLAENAIDTKGSA